MTWRILVLTVESLPCDTRRTFTVWVVCGLGSAHAGNSMQEFRACELRLLRVGGRSVLSEIAGGFEVSLENDREMLEVMAFTNHIRIAALRSLPTYRCLEDDITCSGARLLHVARGRVPDKTIAQ